MSSFFSSFSLADLLPTVYAEEQKEPEAIEDDSAASESKEEEGEEAAPAEEEEEEEEEEPQDPADDIREKCGESKACHGFKHHYEECAERVQAGNVKFPGENCVEELFHFMHCVDDCAAPKVFKAIK